MNNQILTQDMKLVNFTYIAILTICWLFIGTLKVFCQDLNANINQVKLIKGEQFMHRMVKSQQQNVNKDRNQIQRIQNKFDNVVQKNIRELKNYKQQQIPSKVPKPVDRAQINSDQTEKRIKVQGFRMDQDRQTRAMANVVINNNVVPQQPQPIYQAPVYPTTMPYVAQPAPLYPAQVYPQPYPVAYPTYPSPYPYSPPYSYPYPSYPYYAYPPPYPAGYPPYQPVVQQTATATTSTNKPTNIVISPTAATTISTAPNGSTTMNIQPTLTAAAINSQFASNLINTVITNLIPKTDPSFYNTGMGESVRQFKNISLSISQSGSAGSSVVVSSPVNTTRININNTNNAKSTNITENTNATATAINRDTTTTPELTPSQIVIPNSGRILPLVFTQRMGNPDIRLAASSSAASAPAGPNLRATTDENTDTVMGPIDIINDLTSPPKVPTIDGTIIARPLTSSTTTTSTASSSQVPPINLKYQEYLAKFKPNYLTGNPSQVSVYRQTIFNLNIATINQHNNRQVPLPYNYTMGVNLFVDLAEDEFNRKFAKLIIPDELRKQAQAGRAKAIAEGKPAQTDPPKIYIDWRCQNTPLITQGVCGACYTIAALDTIQINTKIIGSNTAYLSIQQVISCGKPSLYLNGCIGGYFKGPYEYVQQNGVGQVPFYYYDDKALFEGSLTDCDRALVDGENYNRTRLFIKGSKTIRMGDCEQLINQLRFRTIAVAMTSYGFHFYTSGTFTAANKNINHGVTLVGYHPVKGYLIKNSWGIFWGLQGYGYVDATTGICDYAMYPILMSEAETPPPQPSAPCNQNFDSPFQD